jgi:hypothetical protein
MSGASLRFAKVIGRARVARWKSPHQTAVHQDGSMEPSGQDFAKYDPHD